MDNTDYYSSNRIHDRIEIQGILGVINESGNVCHTCQTNYSADSL